MHGHLNVQFVTMHGHLNVKFSFEQATIFLPENGAARAETCRTDLINDNIYSSAFIWYIKDIISLLYEFWQEHI